MTFIMSYKDYSSRLRDTLNIEYDAKDCLPNPILIGTPIVSLIPPQDIYNELSTYISSLNETEIVDTRTDVQKAESAGFDRKTSFRNIK